MQTNKHYSLYVLKLEEGKYYVGITSKTPEERFKEHKNGFYGAEWTKIYKPIKIDQSIDLGITTFERAEAYENKVTRKYIKEYGLDNVRGGNITYRGKMVKKFGYIWRIDDWKDLTAISLALVYVVFTLIYLIVDQFFYHHAYGLFK